VRSGARPCGLACSLRWRKPRARASSSAARPRLSPRARRAAQGLLGRVRDRNRQVQEAACSALATLEEAAGGLLAPRLPAILDTLAGAVPAYSRRNLRLLYDSLSTLADAVGPALAEARALSRGPRDAG